MENDSLQAIAVPAWGGNLISLIDRTRVIPVLNTPRGAEQFREEPVLFGMPVLFPPNRIADGQFTFRGKAYRLPITEPDRNNHEHGFLFNRPWVLSDATSDDESASVSMVFDSSSHADVLSYFPHVFRVQLDYTLQEHTIFQHVTVTNHGDNVMPCGIGFHTTFSFPFVERSTSDSRVRLAVDQEWCLDERMLPTGERRVTAEIDQWKQGRRVFGESFDNAYTARHVAQADEATGSVAELIDEWAGVKVTYHVSSAFKHWVVYNADGRQGYISLEPYTWITNAPNLSLPPEVTGFKSLGRSESLELVSSIQVEAL